MKNDGDSEIEIRNLRKKDYRKAILFAVDGMSFSWYYDNRHLAYGFAKYIWCVCKKRATHLLGAYEGDELLGVLMAGVEGHPTIGNNVREKLSYMLMGFINRILIRGNSTIYTDTAEEMFTEFDMNNPSFCEIAFMATNPDINRKGVGTLLLNAIEEEARGRDIHLMTDDGCTYQFYEHRGFKRVMERDIVLRMPKGDLPIKCMMYSKIVDDPDGTLH